MVFHLGWYFIITLGPVKVRSVISKLKIQSCKLRAPTLNFKFFCPQHCKNLGSQLCSEYSKVECWGFGIVSSRNYINSKFLFQILLQPSTFNFEIFFEKCTFTVAKNPDFKVESWGQLSTLKFEFRFERSHFYTHLRMDSNLLNMNHLAVTWVTP